MEKIDEIQKNFDERQAIKAEMELARIQEEKEKDLRSLEELRSVSSAALWRIIVDPIEPETESEGGVKYTTETIESQKYLRYYGRVVDIGPLAFTGERFRDSNGNQIRACEVGDWIVYGQHTGIDICIREGKDVRRMRAINDDHVLAVIHDIEQVKIPLV